MKRRNEKNILKKGNEREKKKKNKDEKRVLGKAY